MPPQSIPERVEALEAAVLTLTHCVQVLENALAPDLVAVLRRLTTLEGSSPAGLDDFDQRLNDMSDHTSTSVNRIVPPEQPLPAQSPDTTD